MRGQIGRRLLLASLAVVLVVPALGVAALLLMSDTQYRWLASSLLEARTGGAVVINGPFSVTGSLTPTFVAGDVVIADPGSTESGQRIGTIALTVDLRRSLVDRRLVLTQLRIADATFQGPTRRADASRKRRLPVGRAGRALEHPTGISGPRMV